MYRVSKTRATQNEKIRNSSNCLDLGIFHSLHNNGKIRRLPNPIHRNFVHENGNSHDRAFRKREAYPPPRSGQPSPGKSNLEQGRPVAILLSESSPNPERIGPHSTRGAQAQSRSDFHNVGPTPKQYDWPSLRKGPPMRKRPRDRGRFHGGRGLNGAERKRRGMGRDGEVRSVSRRGFRSRAPAQSG